jgi:hypothetical protein
MKQFNTSGPNIIEEHYTLSRSNYLQQGVSLVEGKRYFTIWAPRQTGKSTYFRQLAEVLNGVGYEVAHINFENYKDENREAFLNRLRNELEKFWQIDFSGLGIAEVFFRIEQIKGRKLVLVIDEIEGVNPEYFGSLLHSIRNAYHSRAEHSLKSVILVGVTNIVGVVSDNASPFNIAENLNLEYFTKEETFELLKMHEDETGQLFEEKVKEKIYEITAGQPGLVNGFAYQLVRRYPDEKLLNYDQYLEVEHWYLNIAIDKNVANIINKAKDFRPLVERLLFTEAQIPFDIDRESIKVLHTNGIIKEGIDRNIEFWVPLYKKRLFKAFYPYTNGEGNRIGAEVVSSQYFDKQGKLKLETLIQNFKNYVNRRGFDVFREKTGEYDEYGNPIYNSIPEAALVYAFETFIQAVLQALDGNSYREAQVALGRTDLLINIKGEELLIETKIFYHERAFTNGKKQLAYYAKHLGLAQAVYLVFMPEHLLSIHKETVFESVGIIEGIDIYAYLVPYEEDIPDYRKLKKKKIAPKKKV